ncbi:MAG: hypothetical protein QXU32_06275 [Nitrososphaerales archaeon]
MTSISTGSASLDKMLDGGVRVGVLTDVFGASASGKTQLCFELCVNCTKPKNKGGLDANALFIDATNTFRPERILSIARSNDINSNILDKIYLQRVYSSEDQIRAIERIPSMRDLKLVIVDSISDLFSFEYKQSLAAEKHMRFMQMMRQLAAYAVNCDIAVVVTNNVRSGGGEQTEYLGRSISSYAHVKIAISKENSVFKAKLLYPALESRTALFKITEKGITDV